ncbi:MAG TPA: glutamate formiminotransferase [Acidimicrobiia bacterium]|nr:glutamate formiminotransferase [Acidimicrobiia bacterium]
MLECVVNVSEGRVDGAVDGIARAAGAALLDVHRDGDHNRSVVTVAGGTHSTLTATRRIAAATAAALDLSNHDGVHPRLGALDVVPFVALGATAGGRAVASARAFATWWAKVYNVPCFFYDDADPRGRDLPSLRREAFVEREPDLGPAKPHPRLGATAVGARAPLVAFNCVLDGGTTDDARAIAREVRARDGGLRGVRALGFWLESRARPQVSMNLIDLEETGVDAAWTRVVELAAARGLGLETVELVGLLPAAELDRCGPRVRAAAGLDERRTIEGRFARP